MNLFRSTTREKGFNAESRAVRFLRRKGLKIKHQNYQCKVGEIDIIALDENSLVFIEVRHRKNQQFGSPAETVDYRKQQKIIRTSQYFLQQNKMDIACRFDVIESISSNGKEEFNWIRNAFDAF